MDSATSLYNWRKLNFKRELRQNMTPAEQILWEALRNRKFQGTKWRRQANIDIFIADFLCKEHKLIIELDGEIHRSKQEQDSCRTEIIVDYGYRVVRFSNDEVLHDLPMVLQKIAKEMAK